MTRKKPLIVLNDKRYHRGSRLSSDKRMLLDIEELAAKLSDAYPMADILAVKFRDMPLVEQLQMMAATTVFITTAGSSSHMAVFMRPGSSAVVVGGLEDQQSQKTPWIRFTPFDELDRWFPLTYVQFQRYAIDMNDTEHYTIVKHENAWEPDGAEERDRWWRYNANIRVDMKKLRPMLDQALGL